MVDFLLAMIMMAVALVLFAFGAMVVWNVYLDRPSHLTPKQAWEQMMGKMKGQVKETVTPYVPGNKDKTQSAGPQDPPAGA